MTVTRQERLRHQPLNIVMPLSGRLDRLQSFLDRLGPVIDQGQSGTEAGTGGGCYVWMEFVLTAFPL